MSTKLHEKYVVVSVDKATQNVAIICKNFYIKTLIGELGLAKANGNDTYIKVGDTNEAVIHKHLQQLKDNFNISVDENMEKHPLYNGFQNFTNHPSNLV